MVEHELEMQLMPSKDENLKLTLQFGIRMHHAGLSPSERGVVERSKKQFYKKFLYKPFFVESSMLPVLANPVNAEISLGTTSTKQGIMEDISGTYFYRKLFANPNFYDLQNP
ncbi:unnamed protein product, partial [Auanema sp. JU1783]